MRIHNKSIKFVNVVSVVLAGTTSLVLCGCFTGIEHAGKIKLSKEDRIEVLRQSDEESLLSDIKGTTANTWKTGKKFIVIDNDIYRIFEQGRGLKSGEALYFKSCRTRLSPSGDPRISVIFTDSIGNIYTFHGSHSGTEHIESTELPMMVDSDLVDILRLRLSGQKVWTETALWLDSRDKPLRGLKYAPVTITNITPGTMSFPYKVSFKTETGAIGAVYMTYSGETSSSRPFHHLFSMTDPRLKYKRITDDIWRQIQHGIVSIGMTKEECRLSLGTPAETDTSHDYSKIKEIWIYPDGKWLKFEDGLLTDFRK